MMLFSFPLAFLVIRTIKETNYEDEQVVYVDDVNNDKLEQGVDGDASSVEKTEPVAETKPIA